MRAKPRSIASVEFSVSHPQAYAWAHVVARTACTARRQADPNISNWLVQLAGDR
jgi:hypothetical protein